MMNIKIYHNMKGRGSTVVAYHDDQSDSFIYDPALMTDKQYADALSRIADNVSGATSERELTPIIDKLKSL